MPKPASYITSPCVSRSPGIVTISEASAAHKRFNSTRLIRTLAIINFAPRKHFCGVVKAIELIPSPGRCILSQLNGVAVNEDKTSLIDLYCFTRNDSFPSPALCHPVANDSESEPPSRPPWRRPDIVGHRYITGASAGFAGLVDGVTSTRPIVAPGTLR